MKWMGVGIFALSLVLGLNFSRCGGDANTIDTVACPIAAAVNRIQVADSYYNKKVQLKTGLFYGANEYKRTWLKKRRPDKIYRAFINEVRESSRYGFIQENYHISQLEEEVDALYDNRKRTNADISNLDIKITASFFLFTTHLIEGRIRYAGAREFLWQRGMPLENDIALLLKMKSASDLRKELEDLHPKDIQYRRLQQALKKYQELQASDTFRTISAEINVKPGETHRDIPVARRKLALTHDVGRASDTSTFYDDALMKAVNMFKERHGLKPDSILNEETVALLNIPLRQKAELIALNLERLRWLPHIQGDKDEIVINVPEYMLRVYKNNKQKMEMRVVLGSEFNPTPVFHDTLKYIVFSPTWMVPNSIFANEFFPRLKENPAHYSPDRFRFYKNGVEIDPTYEPWTDDTIDATSYSVIEKPGDANSLGSVKFIMPNDFSIYLHDTPADQLFNREERALSHGCVRLEYPVDLAVYVLSDQKDWNVEKIKEAMEAGEPVKVDLEKPYPVYIVYRTAWVDDKDIVHFRNDIYGHDQRHLAYLHQNESLL